MMSEASQPRKLELFARIPWGNRAGQIPKVQSIPPSGLLSSLESDAAKQTEITPLRISVSDGALVLLDQSFLYIVRNGSISHAVARDEEQVIHQFFYDDSNGQFYLLTSPLAAPDRYSLARMDRQGAVAWQKTLHDFPSFPGWTNLRKVTIIRDAASSDVSLLYLHLVYTNKTYLFAVPEGGDVLREVQSWDTDIEHLFVHGKRIFGVRYLAKIQQRALQSLESGEEPELSITHPAAQHLLTFPVAMDAMGNIYGYSENQSLSMMTHDGRAVETLSIGRVPFPDDFPVDLRALRKADGTITGIQHCNSWEVGSQGEIYIPIRGEDYFYILQWR